MAAVRGDFLAETGYCDIHAAVGDYYVVAPYMREHLGTRKYLPGVGEKQSQYLELVVAELYVVAVNYDYLAFVIYLYTRLRYWRRSVVLPGASQHRLDS